MDKTALIVAIVAGFCNIIAVIITSASTRNSVFAMLDKAQAVTETKLEALTVEVRKHNSFAERIPLLEERMKVANHRLDDLENERKAAQ